MASPHLHSMFHMASGADPNSWRAGAIGSGTHSTFVAASELTVGHRSIDFPLTVAVAASTKRSTTKRMSLLLPQHKHIVILLISCGKVGVVDELPCQLSAEFEQGRGSIRSGWMNEVTVDQIGVDLQHSQAESKDTALPMRSNPCLFNRTA